MQIVKMKPSVLRVAGPLVLIVGGCMVGSGYTARGAEFWPRTGELAGGVMVAFAITCVMFVPVELQFDRVELTIRYLLRRGRTIPWIELDLYGSVPGAFVLQFEDQSFQIVSAAFAKADWWQLTNFLSTRFPECRADGYAGGRLLQWSKK